MAIFPAILLAIFRGDVGTDTANYISIFDAWSHNVEPVAGSANVEIGFFLLSQFFLWLGLSSRWVLGVCSFLVCILLITAFSRSREDAIVFLCLVFPIFFYDMSMNGLRYGLAFCLAKMALDQLDARRKGAFLILLLIALSIHISAIGLVLLLQSKKIVSRGFYFVAGAGSLLILVFLIWDRLMNKVDAYGALQSPGELSGLAPLLIFCMVCALSLVTNFREKYYLLFLFVMELGCFILARYSYAGLRLQLLVLFALFCYLPTIRFLSSRNKEIFIFGIILVGALGFLSMYKNMLASAGTGDSPFIPYHYVWDVKDGSAN
ncbi:EpsG family protein [Allopusillimonas ginsengisoli]|uniref:EpsG family protein n=1 Tax=Allopusillimonas ginsengisoli TaxID=453575 RepID=UPI0039C4A613